MPELLNCVAVWPNSSPKCFGRTAAHATDKVDQD